VVVSEKYRTEGLFEMFRDTRWSFSGPKTLTGENYSNGSIDPRPYGGRPHTACTTTNINKVKHLEVLVLISVFLPDYIFYQAMS